MLDRSKYEGTFDTPPPITQYEGEGEKFHKIKEGKNGYRICPPHANIAAMFGGGTSDGDSGRSMEVSTKIWVPIWDKQYKKVKSRPLISAAQHGNGKPEIWNEFYALAKKVILSKAKTPLERIQRKEEMKTSFPVRFQRKFACYAINLPMAGREEEERQIKRLEITSPLRDKINQLIGLSDKDQEPLNVDSLVNPDTGAQLVITMDPNATDAHKYYQAFLSNLRQEGGGARWDTDKMTDKELETLYNLPSLKSLYVGSYGREAFIEALEVIILCDSSYEFGICRTAEWAQIMETYSEHFPEEDTQKQLSEEPPQTPIPGATPQNALPGDQPQSPHS